LNSSDSSNTEVAIHTRKSVEDSKNAEEGSDLSFNSSHDGYVELSENKNSSEDLEVSVLSAKEESLLFPAFSAESINEFLVHVLNNESVNVLTNNLNSLFKS
jgi:hypothetical protein